MSTRITCIAWLLVVGCTSGCTSGPTELAEPGVIEARITARAVVEPTHGTARIAFPSIARVIDVAVEVGDAVTRGQTLARYERDVSLAPEPLTSPIDGVVVARRVSPGDDVSRADGSVFEVVDPTSLRLRIEIEDDDVGRVSRGARVTFLDDASLPSTSVERIAPAMEARAIEPDAELVSVAFASLSADERLAIGRRFDVAVALPPREVAVRVPREAVSIRDGHAEVEVPASFGSERRVVELGAIDATFVEITRGLSAGTRVLVGER